MSHSTHNFSVAAVGGSGPKSTAINFVKTTDGVRLWAWIANEKAAELVPGMLVRAEQVSFGKTETTYEKDGQVFELKVPRQQVFLGGSVTFDAPESEPMAEIEVTVTDKARAYREAYLAKKAQSTDSVDDSF